jgi:hypothetical protein
MGNIGRRRRRIEVLPTEPVTVPEPAPAFVAWCSLCRSGRGPHATRKRDSDAGH